MLSLETCFSASTTPESKPTQHSSRQHTHEQRHVDVRCAVLIGQVPYLTIAQQITCISTTGGVMPIGNAP